jgi:hypothetical protein
MDFQSEKIEKSALLSGFFLVQVNYFRFAVFFFAVFFATFFFAVFLAAFFFAAIFLKNEIFTH